MNKIPLIENACRELLQYGVFDGKAKGKYLIKRYLLGRRVAAEDLIFWPTGLLAAGLWHCREELGKPEAAEASRLADKAQDAERKRQETKESVGYGDAARTIDRIEQSFVSYYERWFHKGMPLAVLDDLTAGETLLNIYEEMQNGASGFGGKLSGEQIRSALDKMADFAAACPKDEAGSFYYRPANGERTVFADGIGLAAPFLYRYGELFGKTEYRELALRQIENFLSCGMDGETGLPYHGYDGRDGCKYGIIGWGRAVGWLLRGMAGCMTSDPGREKAETSFVALVDQTLVFQRQDGYFSWQLEALDGPADTSATGMLCAAVKAGIGRGILADAKYEKALSAGKCALGKSVRDGRVYDCSGECEGFSCYPQRYGAYPWSLGPALEVL